MEDPRSSVAGSAKCGNNTAMESKMTNAKGDKMSGGAADTEATQHDLSTTAESIDPNSGSQLHTVGKEDGKDFDDMIEQLLDSKRAGKMLLDVVVAREDFTQVYKTVDETTNNSQMMSRDKSQFVE